MRVSVGDNNCCSPKKTVFFVVIGRIFLWSNILLSSRSCSSSSTHGGTGGGLLLVDAGGVPHDAVIHLTTKNYDEELNDPANGLWFLKFYAPWCGHCKKLAPILDKVAPYLKGKMAFGKIDCTTDKSLCKRFDIKGYPTLKIFRDGDYFDYPGERHPDRIIDFAERMSSNPVPAVSTLEEIYADDGVVTGKNVDGVAFVLYEKELKGQNVEEWLQSTTLTQVFNQIARKQQAYATFGMFQPDVAVEEVAKLGIGTESFIAKVEKDVEPILYDGPSNSAELLDFITAQNHALVTNLGPHNFRTMGQLGKPLAIGVVDPSDEVRTKSFKDEIRTYAKGKMNPLRFEYNFCVMDGIKWEKFLQQFDIEKTNLPELFVLDYEKRLYWQDPSVFSVKDFIEGVHAGDIISKKQTDFGGGNPLEEVLAVFQQYMPWSGLFMAVLFGATFLLFMPMKDGGNYDDDMAEEEAGMDEFYEDEDDAKAASAKKAKANATSGMKKGEVADSGNGKQKDEAKKDK